MPVDLAPVDHLVKLKRHRHHLRNSGSRPLCEAGSASGTIFFGARLIWRTVGCNRTFTSNPLF